MERKSFTMKQQSDHMILVHTGWPTRPDIYSCNYAQGFSDALENMYCDVTTPCACTNNIFCLDRESPELLPGKYFDNIIYGLKYIHPTRMKLKKKGNPFMTVA